MKKDIKLRIWGRVLILPYYIKYIAAVSLVLISIIIGLFLHGKSDDETIEITTPAVLSEATPEVSATPKVNIISVYIVGAVKQPGIYELPSGSLVNAAVEAAGGFSEGADLTAINLVETIESNAMIKVPFTGETGGIVSGGNGSSGNSGSQSNTKVNLNSAGIDELCTVPGIGESTAKKIISYRETNGPFSSIEEIMNVSGIKQAKFEVMKEYICIG